MRSWSSSTADRTNGPSLEPSEDDDEEEGFGEDSGDEDPFTGQEESGEEETTSDEIEQCCTINARESTRRRSSMTHLVSESTRQNVMQHVHAGLAVVLGTHIAAPAAEEETPTLAQERFTSAAKKLLGPLGRVNLRVDQAAARARTDLQYLRDVTTRYQTIHHTFWSNLALAFWLGFWIALIGLPNYALTARLFIYGETNKTAELIGLRGVEWEHYWCDLQENGMSNEDLENVTSCETLNAVEKHDFDTQMFLNVSRSPYGKVCGYRPGRRYFGNFKRFWIGNAQGNYFPTLSGNKAVYAMPLNYTENPILDYGAICLHMCEAHRNCTFWSWKDMTNGNIFGGACELFNNQAIIDTRLTYNWQHFIGGSCQSEAKRDFFCEPNMYGRMMTLTSLTQEPDLRKWNDTMGPWHENRVGLWCGVLPEVWAATWPNVVQMVVFSVFGGTGTTLQLCWQGFVGTTCACLNVFFMSLVFPYGAKAHECTAAEAAAEECREGDLVYESPGYAAWIGWLDTLGVLFLFMMSNSQINTIKFGMSWHFYFMMDFIDPNDGRTLCPESELVFGSMVCVTEYWFVVLVTTVLGCFFAALATFVPCPLFNSRKAFQDMISTMGTVSKIWEEAVEYICGTSRTAKRFHLEAKIDAISQMNLNVAANLKAAWWESALLARFEPRRQIMMQFQSNIADIVDILPAVKSCVLNEDFTGKHEEFVRPLHPQLQAMVQEATALTELCLSATYEKQINAVMKSAILQSKDHIRKLQRKLVFDYKNYCPKPSDDLADETIMVFSVSFTARKAADLAQRVIEWNEEDTKWRCWRGDNVLLLVKGGWEGLCNSWAPAKIFSPDHLAFATRNFVGITIVFFLAIRMNGYVFKSYDPTMPATLALLISQYQSTAFTNNLHRLLGVLLGKVLPLLILSGLSIFDCGSKMRSAAAFLAIWLYVWVFMYMYFTSQTWSLVGCLIAGFGVYPLLTTCSTGLNTDLFNNRYCELGQITMALAVQLLVDSLLKREGPEAAAIGQLGMLLDRIFLGYTPQGGGEKRKSGLQAVLGNDLEALQKALNEADACMARARSLVTEADPKSRIAAGPQTPFKIALYRNSLDILQNCMNNLTLFLMASKTWAENESVRDIEDEAENPAMAMDSEYPSSAGPPSVLEVLTSSALVQAWEEKLQNHAQIISEALQLILSHRIETKLEDRCLDLLQRSPLIDATLDKEHMEMYWEHVYRQISNVREYRELTNHLQTRVQVASRAFRQLAQKLGELHSLCLKAHIN